MSLDKVDDPIYLSRPFIATIAPQNSTLLLFKKKGGFDITAIILLCSYVISVCAGVFSTAQKHAPNVSAFGMCLHLFSVAPCSPHSTV